jgi:hypothetical protein
VGLVSAWARTAPRLTATEVRQVSRRFAALVPSVNRWVTECEWTNDGGATWQSADIDPQGSTVTAAATSQTRWTCSLNLVDVPIGTDGINGYNTQIRLRHGMDGEPLLPFGTYKVTSGKRSSGSRLSVAVAGASFETYLIRARFTGSRTFRKGSAMDLATQLITEVLPSAQIAWNVGDALLPRIVEPQDRWPLIDGDQNATSVARSLGARIYCTPEGNWVANPVPSLADAPVWSAAAGDGGVLLSADEELSDDGVYNIMVVSGQSTSLDSPPFKPGVAQDVDPFSPTYVCDRLSRAGSDPGRVSTRASSSLRASRRRTPRRPCSPATSGSARRSRSPNFTIRPSSRVTWGSCLRSTVTGA